MSSHEKTRALLEAVADEMNTTEMSAVSRYKMTGWVAKLRAIASSLEGQADAVEDGEGFFHLDNLAAVCQREGFSDRDYERLSYALEVTRTAQAKDKPA